MIKIIIIITFISKVFPKQQFNCGPYMKCLCQKSQNNDDILDCTNTGVELVDICNYVRYNASTLNITNLIARDNKYVNVSSEILIGCEKLAQMDLSRNEITHVRFYSFTNMTHLEILDLSFNKLEIYTPGTRNTFLPPFALKRLKVNGNVKPKSDKDLVYPKFNLFTFVKEIFLDGLSDREVNIFGDSLNQLEILQMSGLSGYCNISRVTRRTFASIQELKVLNISGCNLAWFEFGALRNFINLEILDMSFNINLGFNALENVSYGLQFTDIKVFNYSHAHKQFGPATLLRQRDICYLWNTSLYELVLDGNRMDSYETNALLFIPKSLNVIRVRYNRFQYGLYVSQLSCMSNVTEYYGGYSLKGYFPNEDIISQTAAYGESLEIQQKPTCPFMTSFFLRIRSQDDCIAYGIQKKMTPSIPKRLKKIDISHSGMDLKLAAQFLLMMGNNAVEYIDISDNFINSWNFAPIHFQALRHLDISRNQCTNMSTDVLKLAENLESLQMEHNLLGLVLPQLKRESPFRNMHSLRHLNLSYNEIKHIPFNLFAELFSLESIDLSNNLIEQFNLNVSSMTNLTYIGLRKNFIHSLPTNLLSHLIFVSERRNVSFHIDLRENTIYCSCKNKLFLEWLVEHKNNMIRYDEYEFVDESGQNVDVKQFENAVEGLEKRCASYTMLVVVCSILMAVIMTSLIGSLVYRNRWKIRYFIYMSKAKYFGYHVLPNDEHYENFKYDAFISYAEENVRFIVEEIIPNLQYRGLCLCVHERDFIAGRAVADNIIDAIQASKRTVVVLTKAFLKRRWCMYEFQMARMESIYSRNDKGCLLVVMLENIEGKDMPLEMMNWIRYESYIEYTHDAEGNALFWDRLRDAIIA